MSILTYPPACVTPTQAAGLARGRGEDPATVVRRADRDRLPLETTAGWLNPFSPPFTTDAFDWHPLSRVTDPGSEPNLAHRLPGRHGRRGDPRGVRQDVAGNAEAGHRDLQAK